MDNRGGVPEEYEVDDDETVFDQIADVLFWLFIGGILGVAAFLAIIAALAVF